MILQAQDLTESLVIIGFFLIFGLVGCVIQILLTVWTHKDAKARNMSADLWAVVVLIFGLLGLIIYLIVRSPKAIKGPEQARAPQLVQKEEAPAPQPTKKFCSECGSEVKGDAQFCPLCGNKIRAA
ncbi:MAG: zinc-ribbon domain-containing protein [Promethearchaeota archaeon]|nr:MAG: zinc-ribbon domain-containing protein [Candidatus Lokiarchaeota archaeon]